MIHSYARFFFFISFYFFLIYLTRPAALGPGVHSVSNRNEYREQRKCFWRVKRGWCVGLTTLPPFVYRRLSRPGVANPNDLAGHVGNAS
jgi:hypothetical protein